MKTSLSVPSAALLIAVTIVQAAHADDTPSHVTLELDGEVVQRIGLGSNAGCS